MTSDTLRALRAYAASLGAKSKSGLSTEEISTALGVSTAKARAIMRELMKSGRLKFSGSRVCERIDGRRSHTPVYEVVK